MEGSIGTAIYYFSGTGNSLHVARELQKRLPESRLIPIVRLLDQDAIRTTAETVGLVFPNFCMTLPIPVHDFLKKVDPTSAEYLFAVCTRGGTTSDAFDYANQTLKKAGQRQRLDAQLDVTMPWNHPLEENLPATATKERIAQLEAEMQKALDLFSQHVLAKEPHIVPDTGADFEVPGWAQVMSSLIPKSLNYELHRYMYQDLIRFYSDANCIGCGICEQVCLSSRIALVDGRPVWRDSAKCYGCFACINFCPQQAIQVRSKFPITSRTEETDRYHHPSISHKDIAEQLVASEVADSGWKNIYRIGGVAALVAVIVFRRYFGVELTTFKGFGIFAVPEMPVSADTWFALFQSRPFLGLVLFELFDIVNYALVGLIFLALYGALRKANRSLMVIATACGLAGIAVYLASNQAFAMLSLSQRHAAATTDAQRALLLAAGEALLSIHNAGAIYQGTGIHLSLFLVLLAGLLISGAMLRSQVFNKATAITRLLANGLGLCLFITLALAPAICWIPPPISAPFRVTWYILIALRLFRLGRESQQDAQGDTTV